MDRTFRMDCNYNKKELHDKIYACFIGKNIGGTMGAPYESSREIHDIKGFTTQKGEPLPNDDLDLQLVWLLALEQNGARLDANTLADYWLSFITPDWNEYGVCKGNLRAGILPPLSGELGNEGWKNSNGAWIRSEIWACLCPGLPNVAMKYAYMDACVDHGIAEGTVAEMFTAAMESYAFVMNDTREIIETALTCIPENSQVAKSVRLVLREYDAKTPWQETREKIVEFNKDFGWFQAPGNVAFVILGLIYGEDDFKKSMIYAINCGDDTDCTGATVGAFMGIKNGIDGIPADWREYIGDRLLTCSINGEIICILPKNLKSLTERIMLQIPAVLSANCVVAEISDKPTCVDSQIAKSVQRDNDSWWGDEFSLKDIKERMAMGHYFFEISAGHSRGVVQYDTEPYIAPNGDFSFSILLINRRRNTDHIEFKVNLPVGFTADYRRDVHILQQNENNSAYAVWKCTLHAGETVNAKNRISVEAITESHAKPIVFPIVIFG